MDSRCAAPVAATIFEAAGQLLPWDHYATPEGRTLSQSNVLKPWVFSAGLGTGGTQSQPKNPCDTGSATASGWPDCAGQRPKRRLARLNARDQNRINLQR